MQRITLKHALLLLTLLVVIAIPAYAQVGEPAKVDVVFAFDLTGSMTYNLDIMKDTKTSIMQAVADLVPGAAFGVVSFADYPAQYTNFHGYSDMYGNPYSGDYAFSTDIDVTTDTAAVGAVMDGLTIRWGADYPECYTRVLWELTQPYDPANKLGITWRPGAIRVVVLFGDAPTHDNDFYSYSTGGDPGRDEIAYTADDLDFQTVVSDVNSQDIHVLTVDTSGQVSPDDAWRTFDYMATETDGIHYSTRDTSGIPEAIVKMIQQTVNPYKVVWGAFSLPSTLPTVLPTTSIADMRGKAVCNLKNITHAIRVPINITNDGELAWPAGDVNVRYNWYTGEDVGIIRGDDRELVLTGVCPISQTVEPGQTVRCDLVLQAPAVADEYEVTLAAESSVWKVVQESYPSSVVTISPKAKVKLNGGSPSVNPFLCNGSNTVDFWARLAGTSVDIYGGSWNGLNTSGKHVKNGAYRAKVKLGSASTNIGFSLFEAPAEKHH